MSADLRFWVQHAGVRVGLALAASAALVVAFDYDARIIATHGTLIAFGTLGELWLLAALRGPGRARVLAWIPFVVSLGLCTLYATVFATNTMFGQNVTLPFLKRYAPHTLELAAALPADAVALGIAGAGAAALLLWWGHLRHGSRILTAPRPRVAVLAGLAAGIVGVAAPVGWTMLRHASPQHHAWWRGEPLSNLVWLSRFHAFEVDPERRQREAREQAIAAAYPRSRADPAARPKHVVLILVDSLRADHLPIYGYERNTAPFLSRLAEEGTLQPVESAYSTCSDSFCGILSTLSSKEYGSLTRRDFRLQDALAARGYETAFFLAGDHEWFGLKDAYGPAVDWLVDATTDPRFGVSNDRLVHEGLAALPDADTRPRFLFFFLMSAHFLAPRDEAFARWLPASPSAPWGSEQGVGTDPEAVRNRYDNGVLQADHQIERIYAALAEKGYLEDATIVISADHGDGLGEKGLYGHSYHLFEEDIRVPLLVQTPDRRPLVQDRYATHVDIAPTLLDAVGVPIPDGFEGASLFGPVARRWSRHETTRAGGCRALIERQGETLRKYLRCDAPLAGRPPTMLYDLTNDPGERQNLAASLSEAERAALDARLERPRLPAVAAPPPQPRP